MRKIFYILLFIFNINNSFAIESKIIYEIENELITNIDIKNEFKYLSALNNQLQNLEKEKIFNIAKTSIIREKIKKIEILKNFKSLNIEKKYLELRIENTYSKLGLNSYEEFKDYLINYKLDIKNIEEKIQIEALWNQLILNKYLSKISIDIDQIKKEINKTKSITTKNYLLSEIIFEIENKDELDKKRLQFNNLFKEMKHLLESESQLKIYEELQRKIINIQEEINQNRIDNVKDYLSNIVEIIKIEEEKITSTDTSSFIERFKKYVEQTTLLQEKYASSFGKNESIKSDSIKRKERIKNIDIELENWKNLKTNSEKMTLELNERKNKIKIEINDNQKNPEKIATKKGQNIQNIENTKKDNEELETSSDFKEEKKETKTETPEISEIKSLKIIARLLNKKDISQRKLPNQTTGLVITNIGKNSPVNYLNVGDVIIEAQKKKIESIKDLEDIVDKALKSDQKTILIVIYNSQNQRRYIGVKLD